MTRCFEAYPNALTPCRWPMTVRVLYGDRYLYVGIHASDPDPNAIRGHFVRRDELYTPVSDDHLQLYLDATDDGHSAQLFAINIRNNQLDGYWTEATQSEDYSANFRWTSATARTDDGWTAVFRIPYASLDHRPGRRQTWKLIVWRGIVRNDFYQEADTKIPAGANCLLCYANNVILDDFPTHVRQHDLRISPELTTIHQTDSGDSPPSSGHRHVNLGGYLYWKPDTDTIVNAMWHPDFSQVEADDFQPTANNQFALIHSEKRPFFLANNNLLSTPVKAIYTRSISAPTWGLRLTRRTGHGVFTVLTSRDRGEGSIIEPGVLGSSLVPQPGPSMTVLGRSLDTFGRWSIGTLFTYRRYREGARNLVVGTDVMWTPTDADRVLGQYLWSTTRNPRRPDLDPSWQGQSLRDSLTSIDWSHGTGAWSWDASFQRRGAGFRAWDGYVPQVGVSVFKGNIGHFFYPGLGGWVDNIQPGLQVQRVRDEHGQLVLGAVAPTLNINATRSSSLQLAWHPDDRQLSISGLRHLRYMTLTFALLPGAHLAQAKVDLRIGDDIDYLTGKKGRGKRGTLAIQSWPVDRLELDLIVSRQYLDSTGGRRLFDEHGAQLKALWYIRRDMYVELNTEKDIVERHQDNYTFPVDTRENSWLFTLEFTWEPTPFTHVYIGYHKNTASQRDNLLAASEQTVFFAKAAYAFSL